MKTLLKIQQKLTSAYLSATLLEEEYEDKTKGEAYLKRYQQVRDQIKFSEQALKKFGKTSTLIVVKGLIREEGSNLVEEFEIFYSNISLEEAEELASNEIPNILKMDSHYIPLGRLITNKYVNLENRKRT